MVRTELLSATESVAYGAMLCGADVLSFPLKFADEVVAYVKNNAVHDVASRSSLASAAMGNIAIGRRTFVTSANGCEKIADMRMPVVIANLYGRGLRVRDSGCLLFTPESNQDIINSVIQLYRICEDSKVMLPGVINIDIPDIMEPLLLPTEQSVNKFLPPLRVHKLDVKNPFSIIYDIDLESHQVAMGNALKLITRLDEKWKKSFRRSFDLGEKYYMDDAEFVVVIAGAHASTGKAVVNKLRELGKKAGLLSLKVIRPWPAEFISEALSNKKVAVIDQDISAGASGILYNEIKSCFRGFCSGFVATGYLQEKDFFEIFERLEKNEEERVWI